MRLFGKLRWAPILEGGAFVLVGSAAMAHSSILLRAGAGLVGFAILMRKLHVSRRTEKERLAMILDAIAEPIYMKNRRHEYTLVNGAFCGFLGFPRESLLGKGAAHFVPVAEAKFHRELDEEVFRTGKPSVAEVSVTDSTGAVHTVIETKSLYRDERGELFVAGVSRDITKKREAEAALRRSEERLAAVVDGSNDGVLDWDLDGEKVFVSDRWKAKLGYEPGEIGESPREILALGHPDDVPIYMAAKAAHFRGDTPQFETELRMRHKDGSYRWMLSRGRVTRDSSGRPIRMAGAQTDITQIKNLEERLRHESSRDELTALFNRRHLVNALTPAIASSGRHGQPLSLCLADIDFFKVVNDLHGHPAGDEVLRVFGSLILSEIRIEDVAARLGGDEFAILFSHANADDAVVVLDRIRHRLRDHIFLGAGGATFQVTATFGLCDAVADDDAKSALARADRVLYRAKNLGRDRCEIEAALVAPAWPARLALVS
jgi:diguanylate cyclase (GGDEF)-like protein/PAS domain S-box-containing protein